MGRPRAFDTELALDHALGVFWRHGFDGTPITELCDAMALKPGSVYAAWGSKRGLFVAALQRYMQTISAEAIHRIAGAPSGLQGIRRYFAHLVDAMVNGHRRWGCLITNSVIEFASKNEADPEIMALFQLHLARLEAAFAAALTRAAIEGVLRPGVGAQDAALLVTVVQGMNVLAKTQPGRRVLERVVDAALAGLTKLP